jgi:hypothetical protein
MYSRYVTLQISDLRQLQTDLVDRNRRDSLQLLRIQDNLNSSAHAMRDILDETARYELTAWHAQFERLRVDLEDGYRNLQAGRGYRCEEGKGITPLDGF